MKDVVLNRVMKELIISKEDFRNYFNEKKVINSNEYEKYFKCKNAE